MSTPQQTNSQPGVLPAIGTEEHRITNRIVAAFLGSNLSLVLILLAVLVGAAALWLTPREEDPQIIVPLADVFVSFPGHTAAEVEQLVTTPLEKILYQIDGVEYVYSMSRPEQAIITVRYYVGEDRERSLVKLQKRIEEHKDIIPPGVSGWVVKPVEIDDVPIVTLTLTSPTGSPSADDMTLRRIGEELSERLAAVKDVSRAYVIGGRPRVVHVYLDTSRMQAYGVSPIQIQRAIEASDVRQLAGSFRAGDQVIAVEAGAPFTSPEQLRELVISTFESRPVFLKDVARIEDGPAEVSSYVRHGWGPARGFTHHPGFTATLVGDDGQSIEALLPNDATISDPAVTIAIAKKKGSNAVWVAQNVLERARELKQSIVPHDVRMVITRNYGMTADEKVNELVEALAVAIFIVIGLLTIGLGWRESLVVAVAVPVVFGLTLAVNLLLGFTINRVTLFALILALGLLVDDPIVDVENIARHFALRRRPTRRLVMEAVAEIRPPLIIATLAVIVSFLPMFFITGMMGPYMRPMALNVPVTMIMSMVVAFTITPWMAYHVLKRKYASGSSADAVPEHHADDPHDLDAVRQSRLYRFFYPLMAPLLHSRKLAILFLLVMGGLTLAATLLAATRHVPLKMLPFDNKNELMLVLDFDRGTTLERSDAAVREFEQYLKTVPEVADFVSYVGVAAPMDFNGLVRHYYLRRGDNVAQIHVNLAGKKNRAMQSHAIGLRIRDDLTAIARRHGAKLKIVETPPGPPVIASVVAEVYGQPDHRYEDLLAGARVVRRRLAVEPGVVDLDDVIEAPQRKLVFVTDKEKAALNGVSTRDVAMTLQAALGGALAGTVRVESERNPLLIELRLPIEQRSSAADLAQINVVGSNGALVPLAEIGEWREELVDQTIYHKNLHRVAYVFAETAGRPPADVVVDVQADRATESEASSASVARAFVAGDDGWVQDAAPRPADDRSFFSPGSGVAWKLPRGLRVDFAGEGEWKITLDVFRDLGLAFGAALVAIYVLLLAQTRSFVIPIVVMLAIPLTVLGVMPGFWLLNALVGGDVGGYHDSVFFTATGMIGMIALAGIVTRDSIILVDFIHLSLARGRSLFDAILESRVVRLRPILLTAGAAMLSSLPITVDPIFSGLAWSLIFGLFASTLFTLFVIPITYWLLYANKPGHGLPEQTLESEPQSPARSSVGLSAGVGAAAAD
ncbi:efflux RND transporter permease subunit [Fontivita pretiosa]|uniref:efflux RND transporter permease subunit n=1 Tax=Fontivita pretiosa TaxID=2989684 RepID=UPI003D162978